MEKRKPELVWSNMTTSRTCICFPFLVLMVRMFPTLLTAPKRSKPLIATVKTVKITPQESEYEQNYELHDVITEKMRLCNSYIVIFTMLNVNVFLHDYVTKATDLAIFRLFLSCHNAKFLKPYLHLPILSCGRLPKQRKSPVAWWAVVANSNSRQSCCLRNFLSATVRLRAVKREKWWEVEIVPRGRLFGEFSLLVSQFRL